MVNSQEPSLINWRVVIPIAILFIISVVAIIFFMQPAQQGQFRPQFVPNPPSGFINGTPLEITFTELDANPAVYQNKLVRVSGTYTRLSPVSCTPYKGPQPRWGLISDGFQMDIIGINEIVRLAPEGAPIVAEGIWRLYEGPRGCGKEPARGTLWYLEARRIIEPNPLQFGNIPAQQIPANTTPITVTTTITATTTITDGINQTATPTPTTIPSLTPSPTITTANPSTGALGTPTPTPTSGTVTSVTATPRPGTGGNNTTPTPAGSTNGTLTPTPTQNGAGNGTPDPTTEALPTSASGTITAPTLQPTPTSQSYGSPPDGGGGYP